MTFYDLESSVYKLNNYELFTKPVGLQGKNPKAQEYSITPWQ